MAIITRRQVVFGSAGLALAGAGAVRAGAAFPTRAINFIIPYGPGGGFDSFARLISPAMEKYLPHRVDVVPMNLAAAGGGKAMAQLYHTRPDGYTIGVFPMPGALILQRQQHAHEFDLAKFTWIGSIGPGDTYALGVRQDSRLRTIADLRALGHKRPVKFTCTGPDGTSYLASVIATKVLGIRPQFITGYRGSNDYIVAAIRGDGDAVIAALSTLKRFQAGGIRIVASFEKESSVPGAEDATALGHPELADVTIERMVAAPPRLPAPIKHILVTALDSAVRDPKVVAWAKQMDIPWTPHPRGSADALYRAEAALFARWERYLPLSPG